MSLERKSDGGARYRPPALEGLHEISSTRVGVTNGLFLKFPTIYAAGDLALLDMPGVAVVGSREADDAARRRAAQLARALVRAGIVVVSGLAAGVDRAAHESAIEHGGRTIAVIGTPLDKCYPREHAQLQERLYREHLVLSAFRWGDRFFQSNFPERNRIMARLARATVVIEAGDTSGALHQAAESVKVGHPLFIAQSVADNPKLKWPARFIGQPHVHVLRSSSDVLEAVR